MARSSSGSAMMPAAGAPAAIRTVYSTPCSMVWRWICRPRRSAKKAAAAPGSVVISSHHAIAPGSYFTPAPMWLRGCHSAAAAPVGSLSMAIRPDSNTSNGSMRRVPAELGDAPGGGVDIVHGEMYAPVRGNAHLPLLILLRVDGGRKGTAEARHAVALMARFVHRHVLVAPAEQPAVERLGRRLIGSGQVDPAGRTWSVSFNLHL